MLEVAGHLPIAWHGQNGSIIHLEGGVEPDDGLACLDVLVHTRGDVSLAGSSLQVVSHLIQESWFSIDSAEA